MKIACNLLQAQKIDVISRVDGVRNAVNLVGDWNAASKNRVIFDVVYHEGGVMKHLHNLTDLFQLLVGNLQPSVEGLPRGRSKTSRKDS